MREKERDDKYSKKTEKNNINLKVGEDEGGREGMPGGGSREEEEETEVLATATSV